MQPSLTSRVAGNFLYTNNKAQRYTTMQPMEMDRLRWILQLYVNFVQLEVSVMQIVIKIISFPWNIVILIS